MLNNLKIVDVILISIKKFGGKDNFFGGNGRPPTVENPIF
jgi:hypothetical protein